MLRGFVNETADGSLTPSKFARGPASKKPAATENENATILPTRRGRRHPATPPWVLKSAVGQALLVLNRTRGLNPCPRLIKPGVEV